MHKKQKILLKTGVLAVDRAFKDIPQPGFRKNNEVIRTFLTQGTAKPLRRGVHRAKSFLMILLRSVILWVYTLLLEPWTLRGPRLTPHNELERRRVIELLEKRIQGGENGLIDRRRRGGKGYEMKYNFLLYVILSSVFYSCTINMRDENKMTYMENETITATELISNFDSDKESIIKLYHGKTLEISDVVFSTGRPKDNIPRIDASYIIFGNFEKNNPCIQCYFDEIVVDDINDGDKIIIRGDFYGIENNKIVLRKCRILCS